jgi:2-oxo-3-hexenedioate decarboxylase
VIDERVAAGLRTQLEGWRAALERGAERVGWKIGLNIPEAQEPFGLAEPVIGHLSSATRLDDGGTYSAGDAESLRLEPEVAVELGPSGSVAGLGAAIEIVDVGRPPGGLEGIVAGNVFHRAFVLGPSRPPSGERLDAVVSVNGQRREAAEAPTDFADVVDVVARHLEAVGERLEPGDRIIAGSLTPQTPLEPGDEAAVEIGPLGRLALTIAP